MRIPAQAAYSHTQPVLGAFVGVLRKSLIGLLQGAVLCADDNLALPLLYRRVEPVT